ncbi:hypothetical protein IFM89_031603 [Coptis chinensis]|uniref:Uncharacterized protein n=1 Tax=Coptis chinensis TaxID=261450 RepID=A0A835H6J9_9MAGN|nr:hypothetical protein IFM89_031603 [Coptis chinensis]
MLEITEEHDEETYWTKNTEAQKERIRQIIKYQKSTYLSSSSFSSAASCSSFSSSSKSSSLLELMKGGSTSLRRLFDMEHISLAAHFKDYSGSPIIKPILLWGSDSEIDGGIGRSISWNAIKQFRHNNVCGSDDLSQFASNGSFVDGEPGFSSMKIMKSKGRLIRTRSYRKLPGTNLWICRGFKFRLKLRRLRIMQGVLRNTHFRNLYEFHKTLGFKLGSWAWHHYGVGSWSWARCTTREAGNDDYYVQWACSA